MLSIFLDEEVGGALSCLWRVIGRWRRRATLRRPGLDHGMGQDRWRVVASSPTCGVPWFWKRPDGSGPRRCSRL